MDVFVILDCSRDCCKNDESSLDEACGEGTLVTVTEKGFCAGEATDEEGGAAGVTVTSGSTAGPRPRGDSAGGAGLLHLAAESPSTISSNFFLFFSLPTICSGAGCKEKIYISEQSLVTGVT